LHHFSNFGQYFRGVEADITRFVPPSFICGYFGPNKKITPTDTDININQKTMKENFGERPWDN
jgi:hypothetical protein